MDNEQTETNPEYPVDGLLWLNGWGGITKTKVTVIGETPKRYRITVDERTKLAGRCRFIDENSDPVLVPKRSITFS